jgi:predicted MFS family arabinose efflux permease
MLPTVLFRRSNFAAGNAETLAMYGGLSIWSFLLTLFLQEVAGWTALAAGAASLPVSVIMFLLSRRFGAVADRYGPRGLMTAGPLLGAVGMLLLLRIGRHVNWATDVLPGVVVFGVGLSMTVAPLTAAVLGGVRDGEAGIASAVNNAVARVAGLVAVAAIGAIVGQQLDVTGFHRGLVAAAVLMALGGTVGAIWIRKPVREPVIHAERCPGGQLVGVPEEACVDRRALPEVATAA